jgi:acyl-CoA thioesterase-1
MMKRFLVVMLILLTWSCSTLGACKNIVVLGDSLSAAHGMRTEQSWVRLLQKRLQKTNPAFCVINTSVGGDTTREGLAKIPLVLKNYKPLLVIIELGGNDGLRGLPIATIKMNLKQIIQLLKKQNVRVLLVSVPMPPNYGPEYTEQFQALFHELSKDEKIPLVKQFLRGVAEHPDLMQPDGIHPTAQAQPKLLENIWETLRSQLNKTQVF